MSMIKFGPKVLSEQRDIASGYECFIHLYENHFVIRKMFWAETTKVNGEPEMGWREEFVDYTDYIKKSAVVSCGFGFMQSFNEGVEDFWRVMISLQGIDDIVILFDTKDEAKEAVEAFVEWLEFK